MTKTKQGLSIDSDLTPAPRWTDADYEPCFQVKDFDRIVGWADTEDEAADLLADLARRAGSTVGLWITEGGL